MVLHCAVYYILCGEARKGITSHMDSTFPNIRSFSPVSMMSIEAGGALCGERSFSAPTRPRRRRTDWAGTRQARIQAGTPISLHTTLILLLSFPLSPTMKFQISIHYNIQFRFNGVCKCIGSQSGIGRHIAISRQPCVHQPRVTSTCLSTSLEPPWLS